MSFKVIFPTNRELPSASALADWLKQRGEPFLDNGDGSVRLRAIDMELCCVDTMTATLDVSAWVDLTRLVDLVFELSIMLGADVRLQGVGDVTRGQLWLVLADEQDRMRIAETLQRADLTGRREEIAQRLWQIVSAIRPGKDDRWDAKGDRIVELKEVGAPDGISLADAHWHADEPEAGDLVAVPVDSMVHSLAWRWLSEAYPGLAEAEHTFH